jgi:hypothetical protein
MMGVMVVVGVVLVLCVLHHMFVCMVWEVDAVFRHHHYLGPGRYSLSL